MFKIVRSVPNSDDELEVIFDHDGLTIYASGADTIRTITFTKEETIVLFKILQLSHPVYEANEAFPR